MKNGLRVLERNGALLDGHFVLDSERHTAQYIEKLLLFTDPRVFEDLSCQLAWMCRGCDPKIDVVCGPTTVGLALALNVARALGDLNQSFAVTKAPQAVFADEGTDPVLRTRVLRPAFQTIVRNRRVLVVDDVLTQGTTLALTIEAVLKAGGDPVLAAVLFDRGETEREELNVPYISLYKVILQSSTEPECLTCHPEKEVER